MRAKRNSSPTILLFLTLALFGIFIALLMIFLEDRDAPAAQPAFQPAPQRNVINFRAPDFELPLLDGRTLVSPSVSRRSASAISRWAWASSRSRHCCRPLTMPAFALEGSEEPELVGCYLIGDDGAVSRYNVSQRDLMTPDRMRATGLAEPTTVGDAPLSDSLLGKKRS